MLATKLRLGIPLWIATVPAVWPYQPQNVREVKSPVRIYIVFDCIILAK